MISDKSEYLGAANITSEGTATGILSSSAAPRVMKDASLPVIIALLSILIGACAGEIGEIRQFQLYDGTETMTAGGAPAKVIRGRIDTASIELEYSLKDSSGESRQKLTLAGEKFRSTLELVRATSIREINPDERPTGGNAYDVTLIDEKGRSVIGEPSNKSDWMRFQKEIENKIVPAKK